MFRIRLIGILLCLSVAMSYSQNHLIVQRYSPPSSPIPFIHSMKFQLEGKLLFIKATIDDQSGWVLIDSGFPDILINEKVFTHKRRIKEDRYLQDLIGNTIDKEWTQAAIQIKDLIVKKQQVVLMDLTTLSQKKNRPILGVLGYAFLKQFETIVDYEKKEITFLELTRKGKRKNDRARQTTPTHTVPLKKYNHFLYLKGTIGDQTLKFGLDLGAENNLIGEYKIKKIAPHFTPKQILHLVTFNGKNKVHAGDLKQVSIQNQLYDFQKVLLIDLKKLYAIKGLDAVLGYDFLSKWTIGINYKTRTLSLW